MITKTVSVPELENAALDWAVAQAIDLDMRSYCQDGEDKWRVVSRPELMGARLEELYSPSTNWGQCGPLIFRHIVSLTNESSHWSALSAAGGKGCASEFGPTPLIAACRAVVAAHFGATVEVPEVLL